MIDCVVKLGGSLEATGHAPALVDALERAVEAGHRLLVVPGGGRFADEVRAACARSDPGPDAAHWAAIDAMDVMAGALRPMAGNALLVIGVAAAEAALAVRRLPILAPARWLRAADPLPHSWDVTSDSIAAWVAGQAGAPRLVLLKSIEVGGPPSGAVTTAAAAAGAVTTAAAAAGAGKLRELARAGVVDAMLAQSLPAGTECRVLNGRQPARLLELLEATTLPASPA